METYAITYFHEGGWVGRTFPIRTESLYQACKVCLHACAASRSCTGFSIASETQNLLAKYNKADGELRIFNSTTYFTATNREESGTVQNYQISCLNSGGTECSCIFDAHDLGEACLYAENRMWEGRTGYRIENADTGELLATYDRNTGCLTLHNRIAERPAALVTPPQDTDAEDDEEDEGTPCSHCGERHDEEYITEIDGEWWCDDCRDDNFFFCEDCGTWNPNDEAHRIQRNDRSVCDECFEDHYFECERCGRNEHNDYMDTVIVNAETAREEDWCRGCRDRATFYCNECDNVYANSQIGADGEHCINCSPAQPELIEYWTAPRGLQSYHYRPNPRFCPEYDESTIYYGFELECESHGNTISDMCNKVNDTLGYTYCKHDGSLDNGIEIVSHPATIQYHMSKKEIYEQLFKDMRTLGWRSHDDGSCGLHFHISLHPLEAANPFAIHNMLILYDRFWDKLVRFSRRTEYQLNQWARRYAAKDQQYSMVKNMAKREGNRYMAVNLQNEHTVEIRMWRGTLKPDTFFATLQLVDLITRKCIEIGNDPTRAQSVTWEELTDCNHPELRAQLAKRGLIAEESMDLVTPIDDIEETLTTIRTSEHYREISGPIVPGSTVCLNLTNGDSYNGYNNGLVGRVLYGTVICLRRSDYTYRYGVMFNEYLPGMHNLNGHIEGRYGQFCRERDLTLVEPYEPEPLPIIEAPQVAIGDRVMHAMDDELHYGPGVVVGFYHEFIGVDFDNPAPDGFDLEGIARADHGLWVHPDYLTKI